MIDSQTLLELSQLNLSAEQLTVVLRILARSEQANEDAKRKVAERTQLYRSRGGGKIPEELRQAVFERDGFACVYCGSSHYLQCDHVVPVSKGGATTLDNLAAACRVCNARKRDRDRKVLERSGNVHGQQTDNPTTTQGMSMPRARDVEINNKLPEDNKITPPCSPSKPKKTWETSPEFIELLAVFPPRAGDKDLKGSFNAFNAARKRETFPVIIDGAKRYRDHIDATGKMNTEYVRQIRTWLNKDGWKETYGQDRRSHPGNNSVSKGFDNIRDAIHRRFGSEDARGDGGGGEIIDVLPGLRKGA